jgi:hypothetical protein
MRSIACLRLAALAALLAAPPGHAQDAGIPPCQAATAGQLGSQAGVRCACRQFPASALAGTAAGHRWDCGLLRARLDPLPVDLNLYPYPLPDALSIERGVFPDFAPMLPSR